jgi:UDP-glucose 4-epimerase
MFNVDIIFHAAALKQVPSCEHSPFEAVLTNVVGAQNVIDCAIQHRVERFIAISTDKAVEPVNAMGMSKALQEKLVLAANHRSRGHSDTIFACVRYGNVLGSRGSVVPLFKSWIERRQPVLVTNPNMTRFMLTLDDAVDLVFKAVRDAHGGALYVRKSPAHTVGDLAEVMIAAAGFQPEEYDIREVGIRPGEKIHETLISLPESLHTKEEDEYFVVLPEEYSLDVSGKVNRRNMETTPFRYTSDMAPRLSKNDLLEILQRTGWVPGSKP